MDCQIHRPVDESCETALRNREMLCLCSSPAAGLRNLEQLVVAATQRQKSLEQFGKHLSGRAASVRLRLPVYDERLRSSLHRPIDLSRIQEPERNRLLGCQASFC